MKKYELISHTADVRIKATADTPGELFGVSLFALSSVINHTISDDRHVSVELEVESGDMTALLIDFLSDALYYMHERKSIFHSVDFFYLRENRLSAILHGYESDGFDEDVKAVTYHEAEIKRNSEGKLETLIVLDI